MMGFMGTGKTKVGKLIAELMGWQFVDTDACIVDDVGMSISEIFETLGESHFRELEKKWIKKTAKEQYQVISLGGGAVVDEENWEVIHSNGITINLSYPPGIIAERLARKKDRPLLDNDDKEARLSQIISLLQKRKPIYDKADFIFHLNHEQPAEQVAKSIVALLGVHS